MTGHADDPDLTGAIRRISRDQSDLMRCCDAAERLGVSAAYASHQMRGIALLRASPFRPAEYGGER